MMVPRMRVSALAGAINAAALATGGAQEVLSITNDSRQVRAGALYAALPGEHVDGHQFIGEAVRSGAVAVLCRDVPKDLPESVAVFRSEWPRLALSEISDVFYGQPSSRLRVVGVTGTDGKTTTVHFIHQLLELAGARSSFLSTAAMQVGDETQSNRLHQSTPEAPVVQSALAEMVAGGKTHAVLESTSHGLSARTCRLAHVRYAAAVLTNLTHEHLEFHGTFEQYRHDKANLFRALDAGGYARADAFAAPASSARAPRLPRAEFPAPEELDRVRAGAPFAVVNAGCPDAGYFARATAAPTYAYGMELGPWNVALAAGEVKLSAAGSEFTLLWGASAAQTSIGIPGTFNVENALAALLTTSLLLGVTPGELVDLVPKLRPVHGRMRVVQAEPFAVVVDYAHTPGSFERALPFFREHTRGKLIVVFGSGGERDRAKRPQQGRIADAFADIIVLTDEDPRNEDRQLILEEIAAGCPTRRRGDDLHLVPDRREAIRFALTRARPGDTVLLLGKGHEAQIIGRDGAQPWDEESVAAEELGRGGT
jgi:UDP-N-acetylmuramoyl-L-alanyl-D-glutamate--2,6-diaminopimelate ligase